MGVGTCRACGGLCGNVHRGRPPVYCDACAPVDTGARGRNGASRGRADLGYLHNGLLRALCWCGTDFVWVAQPTVRAGRTGHCVRPDCKALYHAAENAAREAACT